MSWWFGPSRRAGPSIPQAVIRAVSASSAASAISMQLRTAEGNFEGRQGATADRADEAETARMNSEKPEGAFQLVWC